jgi:hypothetical protein
MRVCDQTIGILLQQFGGKPLHGQAELRQQRHRHCHADDVV